MFQNTLHYKTAIRLYKQYERFIIPGMLVLGFLIDIITFKSLNTTTTFILLTIHLLLLAGTITYINLFDYKLAEKKDKRLGYLRLLSPLVMQFSIGALLSAAFLFYSFSGPFSTSWPLLIILIGLIFSNEAYKQYYLHPIIQLAIFFFLLYTTLTLILPFIFNTISPRVFVLAGFVAGAIIYGFAKALHKHIPYIDLKKRRFAMPLVIIAALINLLYILNVIPPIPLSLRDIGAFNSIRRTGGDYTLTVQTENIFQKMIPGKHLTIKKREPVSIFASVFAPADLETQIVHHWQWYNKEKGKWDTITKLSYNMTGGRTDGYRGFSTFSNLNEGRWRVFVETPKGQTIGKVTFRITVDNEVKIERDTVKK